MKNIIIIITLLAGCITANDTATTTQADTAIDPEGGPATAPEPFPTDTELAAGIVTCPGASLADLLATGGGTCHPTDTTGWDDSVVAPLNALLTAPPNVDLPLISRCQLTVDGFLCCLSSFWGYSPYGDQLSYVRCGGFSRNNGFYFYQGVIGNS